MAPCVPAFPSITTGFGVKGSAWATGEHGGIDYGSAGIGGAEVRAPWGGTITGANWGSAYGNHVVIDFDPLPDGSPGLWGVIAHMSTVVKSSGRVEVGTLLGYVGHSGNASGDHTHFEIQPQSYWVQGSYRDPMPWHNAGAPAGSPSPGGGYPLPTSGKVYLSKLHYGQEDSDSVAYLQQILNGHSLPAPGNITLPITGGYWDQTGTVVVTCQQVHGFGNDPITESFVGPAQAAHLFDGTGLMVVDDT